MAKVFLTNFKSKRVIFELDGDDLRDDSKRNIDPIDFSNSLKVVVDNTTTSEKIVVNKFLESVQELDEFLDKNGYFDIYSYNQNNKAFQKNAQDTLEKLKKARNLIEDQALLIEELLSDRCGIPKKSESL